MTRGSTLVICLLAPVTWAPPGTDLVRWRAALAEDVVDLLAPLPMVRAAIAATPEDMALAKSIAWPSMPILEIDRATPRAALEAASIFAATGSGRGDDAQAAGSGGHGGVRAAGSGSAGSVRATAVDARTEALQGGRTASRDGGTASQGGERAPHGEAAPREGKAAPREGEAAPRGGEAAVREGEAAVRDDGTASPDGGWVDGGWALDEGDADDGDDECFERAAVVLADAPDLPAMLIGKLLRPLTTRAVAIAPAVGGGLLGVATRLPVPDWLPDLDPETGTLVQARAGAPEPSAVVSTPAWHRLRSAVDLAQLDPGLDGWETTRALLSS